jgi:hypothetical protein
MIIDIYDRETHPTAQPIGATYRWESHRRFEMTSVDCETGSGTDVERKGWDDDPNAYIYFTYFTIQEQNWERTCQAVGEPEWIDDPDYNTARARADKIFYIFAEIEKWLADETKYEAVDILRQF